MGMRVGTAPAPHALHWRVLANCGGCKDVWKTRWWAGFGPAGAKAPIKNIHVLACGRPTGMGQEAVVHVEFMTHDVLTAYGIDDA